MKHAPTALAGAAVTLLALTGCGAAAQSAPVTVTATATDTVTATPATDEPDEATEAADDDGTNDRGNLPMTTGETTTITTTGDDGETKDLADISVTKIDTNLHCTASYADKPENGRFIGVYITVKSTKALKDIDVGDLDFWNGWSFMKKDGTVLTADGFTSAAYSCLNDNQMMSDVAAAKKVTGIVVVDAKPGSGVLAFEPGWKEGGWEWQIGR